jgi:endonuclease-3
MAALNAGQKHARRLIRLLAQQYPDPQCALTHDNPLQLLVATILSAQCTDVRVNMVTPALFARFPDAPALANAPLPELEKLIQSTGFFRNKAKNIKAACQAIVEQHAGELPQELEELIKLPGVGRKTANVVLGSGYGIPSGVVVDTHVGRLSLRLGLTKQTDPVKVERELNALVPQDHWIDFSHELILHGRAICDARKPRCEACVLLELCPQIGVTKTAGGNDPQKIPAKIRLGRMLGAPAGSAQPSATRSSKTVEPRSRKVTA